MARGGRDVVVVGAGPAGCAVALSCVAAGLRTLVVDPYIRSDWPASYATWADEAPADLPALRRWERVRVEVGERAHRVERPYLRVDGAALRGRLLGALPEDSTRADGVEALAHDATGTTVQLRSGEALRAGVVVVTGARNLLHGAGPPTAWQVAYGAWVQADHPWPQDEAVLMDFRPATPSPTPPSFLYALPLGPDRVFLEETVLACRQPLSFDLLRHRLSARLRALGTHTITSVERCRFPMDLPIPTWGQRAVAFGAAAGLVHPATGYQLARALGRAPQVANALAQGLSHSPTRAARLAWEAVWPRAARRVRALHLMGLEALLTLDQAGQADFFDRFFRLPERRWRAVLNADAPLLDTASAMLALFHHAPPPLKARLASPRGVRRGLVPLIGGLP